MSKGIVLLDFSRNVYNDPALILEVRHIIQEMTNNTHYPTPSPALATVKTQVDDFETSLQEAVDGTPFETSIKNDKRLLLEGTMQNLGRYVQTESKSDYTTILSSGFKAKKEAVHVGPLGKPVEFDVIVGPGTGTVTAKCKAVPHATFYEVSYTPAPVTAESVWQTATSTKHTIIIDGLKSGGSGYAFKMAAAGSDPSRNFTDTIIRYPQ